MQWGSVLGRVHRVLLGDGGLHVTAAFSLCLSGPPGETSDYMTTLL